MINMVHNLPAFCYNKSIPKGDKMLGITTIDTADKLVKGFAVSIRDGNISFSDVESLIRDVTDGDERLITVVLEKTQVELDCIKYRRLVG